MNMRFGTSLLALALCPGALAGCGSPTTNMPEDIPLQIDAPHYADLSELAAKADSVFEGRVVSEQADLDRPSGQAHEAAVPQTAYRVIVTRVARGDMKGGDTVIVTQPGGTMKGKNYSIAGLRKPSLGSTYVFYTSGAGPHAVLGVDDGIITLGSSTQAAGTLPSPEPGDPSADSWDEVEASVR